jgi:SAM-dependent methyltransferase
MPLLEIPPQYNRSAESLRDPTSAEASALFLIHYACEKLRLADLAEKEVLDVGCGTKFTHAFVNHNIPVRRYVGVDVYADMIDFLQTNVADPRFEYHHINVRNELYNPDGQAMTADTDFGVEGGRTFDIIWLFSVFTHLAPHDYSVMLKLLRRYVRPDGRLLYTVFINELTDGGHGFADKMHRAVRSREVRDAASGPRDERLRHVQPFVDVYPEHPLRCALYSRGYAFELIQDTGWRPLELLPPNEFAQHQFICAPV